MARNHPILTDEDTKKRVKKRKKILEAREEREVTEDEVVKRALDNDPILEEKEQILGDLFG